MHINFNKTREYSSLPPVPPPLATPLTARLLGPAPPAPKGGVNGALMKLDAWPINRVDLSLFPKKSYAKFLVA